MKISENGLNLIKSFEGLRLKAYKVSESEKYYTIGYGHYGADVKPGMTITKKQADELLKKDVDKFVDGVNKLLKVNVNQNQFDALVSFAYNVGLGALKASTLLKLVNKGAFKEASKEFDLWVRSGGKVLAGLVRRREKEKELFLTPVENAENSDTGKDTENSDTYKVKKGDNLTKIAHKYGTTVDALVTANPQIKDPDLIYPGQILKIVKPQKTLVKNYRIQKGDTLSKIAREFNTTVDKLLRLNPKIKNPDIIYAGDIIKVPR